MNMLVIIGRKAKDMGLASIKKSSDLSLLNSNTIYELQRILYELGYQIDVDGIYGSQTRQVFNQFKSDHKLTHPNLIGQTTVDKLLSLHSGIEVIEDEPKHSRQPMLSRSLTVSDINWRDFSSPVSRWFTVGEVFRFDSQRITNDVTIQGRIVALARELDRIRDDWGGGIGVTSWYRPSSVNRRVGGVSNSRHLFGDAVDIYPINGKIVGFQSWLDKSWDGALGYGAKRGFIHIDMRNGKGWKTGGAKGVRWIY